MRNKLFFNVNGKDITVLNPDPETTLASYLRITLGLTGTKISCGEGSCGACTVVLGKWDVDKARYFAVNACVTPLFLVDGCVVITVEGIGNRKTIHAVQERIAKGHGTQCGFCSPGFVMAAYALLRNNSNPSKKDIMDAIKGNLCRCTGYRPIIEALYSFTDGCCKGKGGVCPCKEGETAEKLVSWSDFPPLDESQELIFPPSLINNNNNNNNNGVPSALDISGPFLRLIVPDSEQALLEAMTEHPEASVVSSGMFAGIRRRQTVEEKETWIGIWNIASRIEVAESNLIIGAACSIAQLLTSVEKYCPSLASGFRDMLDKFSSSKIINLATWAGAIATSKVSDVSTLLRAINADLNINGPTGRRKITVEEFFEHGLKPSEIIVSAVIPKEREDNLFAWKAGMRTGADTTVVNCALLSSHTPRVVFGSGGKSILAINVANGIQQRKSLEELNKLLEDDLKLLESEADFNFRLNLAKAGLFHMYNFTTGVCQTPKGEEAMEFTQIYKLTSEESVGRPISHDYADLSTTGEATFVADHKAKDAVYLGYVLSTNARAHFSVDASAALKEPGVLGFYDVNSIPGTNVPGSKTNVVCPDDTPVFADREVLSHGQPIGVIAAESPEIASRAAKLVKVHYNSLPAITNLQQAIEEKSELCPVAVFGVEAEEVEKAVKAAVHVVEDEAFLGGQEHMYMETQSAFAFPGENDQIVIQSSTQSQAALQNLTSNFINLPAHKIAIKTKRAGGAFGGKSHNSFFTTAVAALVSQDLQRPTVAVLSREEDCKMTGKRHPILFKYKIGLDADGKMVAAFVKVYCDGGYSTEHSVGVAYVAGVMFDICYKVPVIRVESSAMKTNKNSNTAFRGYGNPQVAFVWECIIQKIAFTVGKSTEEIREMNFSHDGDKVLTGVVKTEAMDSCWKEVKKFSKFEELKKEVEEFNKSSPTIKRAVTLGAVRFPLTHDTPNEQASALVQVYMDGSVAVSIGGIEMGQGLFTKCRQVAAKALGIPLERVTMLEAGTDKTANIPETGGSQGADIHGRAIQKAAEKIISSMKPLMDSGKSWDEAAMEAHLKRLPLQISEFITINRAEYNIPDGQPTYFTTGAACVVVEVDCLSGDHKLISVDIVMDVGESLNPAVDIGQIEGGFIQGYGLLSCEEVAWNADGSLRSSNFSRYALPTAEMVPRKFRVKLLGDTPSYPGQVYSSKGIGEPPMMLGAAAYGAVVQAIKSYRKENGKEGWIQVDAPLTRKKILEMCTL